MFFILLLSFSILLLDIKGCSLHDIKMIVGLSNPKKQYNNTRHNTGSWYIYLLAKFHNSVLIEDKRFCGFTAFINIQSKNIRLLVPNIFMNINGLAVYKMASYYRIQLNEILFVHDDLDLKPGFFKLTYSYGHSGHNGLRNILSYFPYKKKFFRYRIGIGRPFYKSEISSFVLSLPKDSEKVLINAAILYAIKDTNLLMSSRNIKI